MALKIRILIIATISIIIASIAGIQSIEVSTNEAYAIKAESTVPSWVKELAQSWIIDEATTSEYLGTLEWLIDEGIMSVDTASAKPSSDIDGVIADLEALEKGLDKLEDKIYEFETGKYLAYETYGNTADGHVFDMVTKTEKDGQITWNVKQGDTTIISDADKAKEGTFDPHNWQPGSSTDVKADLDGDGKEDGQIQSISIKEGGKFLEFDMKGTFDLYSIIVDVIH